MGEHKHNILGLLRLKVEKGVNLAIRDSCGTSDPYIIFHLGKHKVKTHVMKKTTNPQWDEKLTLSVHDPNIPLKLEVWDKDTFKPDDAMGHAEIDLRPLIDVGKQDMSKQTDGDVIKTVVPNRQNHFAEESKIYWSEGKLMQEMVLRLQEVERGEIEMKLIWGTIQG
ncbi:hypothetical protein LUZ60_012699 [Juncus effusus]|nr:hypothetical protein LUZ60_012699 [Juncus effusus]